MNSDWHEKVRKYRGHHCRAAYSLLGYTPHYKSFLAQRRATGIDSVLHGECTGPATEQAEAPIPETVTVAIPSGIPVESGGQSAVREPAAAERAETGRRRQRQKFVVSSESRSTSSSEESEVEMLRGRCQRFVAEDLAAAAFGDMGETAGPSRGADVAPTTSSVAAAEVISPETETARKPPKVLNQVLLQQPRSARVLQPSSLKNRTLALAERLLPRLPRSAGRRKGPGSNPHLPRNLPCRSGGPPLPPISFLGDRTSRGCWGGH